jgi:hypothetical protein
MLSKDYEVKSAFPISHHEKDFLKIIPRCYLPVLHCIDSQVGEPGRADVAAWNPKADLALSWEISLLL